MMHADLDPGFAGHWVTAATTLSPPKPSLTQITCVWVGERERERGREGGFRDSNLDYFLYSGLIEQMEQWDTT